ncbi:MAG: glycerate kinase [Saprospiraceae bacterium]|nr:glycerate kinase [Saprospiraceae bacterium]MCF8249572.1 glycerate kinase [Saprospiraceae bacterium]MCF8280472.1 glycerate kinase [Bacteroidales bacterium]MCF8310404.1 glycerate kinase [Saprospiraceae bacterium]MCF8439782.1 glycerate kinase [Saprospiraceae bacterium]
MKILLCPDKFKGSLSAQEVCRAIDFGLKKSQPQAETTFHPMADGGDGSLEILSAHLNLQPQNVVTTDPLGREITARYFTSADAAFIEVASASGLVLLKNEERNPLLTSTFGTGTLMADALAKGFQNIYLFLGGSATNDAGMGIAAALGCQFLDENGQPLEPIGGNLPKVQSIKSSQLFDFQKIKMTLLCDVTNPLFGPNGAAHVYARQKGATEEQVEYLDHGLRHFSGILQKHSGTDVGNLPGSGAAGGIGASLSALFRAEMAGGFGVISELTGLEKQIQSTDLVISGEGKLDQQSLQGKVVSGVAGLCKKHGKPLVLFVGANDLDEKKLHSLGAHQVFSITEKARDLEDAMANGEVYLTALAEKNRELLIG